MERMTTLPPQPAPPRDTALHSHVNIMANACEMAAGNLQRLQRLKVRLCGVTELASGGGGADRGPQPQPDGLIPRLVSLDDDLSRTLNATAKLIEELDGIA